MEKLTWQKKKCHISRRVSRAIVCQQVTATLRTAELIATYLPKLFGQQQGASCVGNVLSCWSRGLNKQLVMEAREEQRDAVEPDPEHKCWHFGVEFRAKCSVYQCSAEVDTKETLLVLRVKVEKEIDQSIKEM